VSAPWADIAEGDVTEGFDDEGDAYFTTRMTQKDATSVDLTESHDLRRYEDVLTVVKSAPG
jgi:hypothetical protein